MMIQERNNAKRRRKCSKFYKINLLCANYVVIELIFWHRIGFCATFEPYLLKKRVKNENF